MIASSERCLAPIGLPPIADGLARGSTCTEIPPRPTGGSSDPASAGGSVAGSTVLGNVSHLQLFLLNLCLNAIQAMERNRELTVRVVGIWESGSGILSMEVAGTGPRLPEDPMPTVFGPFATTKPHGTGLDPAICRGSADAHHAPLAVRNNSGRPGCTFTVEFPLPSARPSRVAP